MLDQQERERLSEPPLDFTQFLCARLELEPQDTLDLLGSFLLDFEPTSNRTLRTQVGSALPPTERLGHTSRAYENSTIWHRGE